MSGRGELRDPAVAVGDAAGKLGPAVGPLADLDDDGDPAGRLAEGGVKDVGRDRAHGAILSRRIVVIFICSAGGES